MKEYTIKFNDWHSEGTTTPRVITFTNDGQFTRNSVTSQVIPQNEEMFLKTINTYLDDKNNELIYE
jgi:hypothetical protein